MKASVFEAPDDRIALKSRIVDIPRRAVLRLNARMGRYDDIIWLLGSARSGTTWISELINHDKRYRYMFEPIRPARVASTDFLTPHEYVRPSDQHPQLQALMTEIFSGRFTHPRIDTSNRRPLYRGLLVKDCFANLLARWTTCRLSDIRPVLLIRNPFAVALSMQKKPRWYWATDPSHLLAQDDLMADHLEPYRAVLMQATKDDDQLIAMLANWAATNIVPLRQFADHEIHVCFYEDFYERPEEQLATLYRFTSGSGAAVSLSREEIERPSRMASERSTIANDTSPLTTWKHELSSDQINRGRDVLSRFGIDDLYRDGYSPDHSVLERFRP